MTPPPHRLAELIHRAVRHVDGEQTAAGIEEPTDIHPPTLGAACLGRAAERWTGCGCTAIRAFR